MHIVKELKRIRGKACFSGSGFILFGGKAVFGFSRHY